MFDSILFDFDGVLADTERLHFLCWREVLLPHGIDLPISRLPEFVGVADRAMLERLGAERQPPLSAAQLWPSYADKRALFQARTLSEDIVPPAAVELIRKLHLHFKLAVVSSSHRSEIEPPLARAGVLPFFQTLVCGMEIPNLKPAPDPYLRAAELLGARRPLVVEDSDPGVASGLAAGFEVLRVTSAQAMAGEVTRFLKGRGQ